MKRLLTRLARLLIFDLIHLDASTDPLADYPDRTHPTADAEAVTVEINRRPPYGVVCKAYIPPRIYRN